jgi:hypothetical protein
MASDISALVANYRDAARTLWNSHFLRVWERDLPGFEQMNEWDFRDRFEDVCVELFSTLVLTPAGAPNLKIWPAYHGDAVPLAELRVIPDGHVELRVAEPEGNSFRSYDHDLTNTRDVKVDLRFLAFFDYEVLNLREFEFCHCVIATCEGRPHYAGRNVLIRATDARYELSAP